MTAGGTGRGGGGSSSRRRTIPRAARQQVLLRLEPELDRYIDAGAALSFEFEFKGGCLYVAARQRRGVWSADIVKAPLCRLRYTGDPEQWRFEIYLYSSGDYDVDQDFPFGIGTPEECFAVAADFYLLEYHVLDAGSSRERADTGPGTGYQGMAAVLPPLERPDAVEVPGGLPGSAGAMGRPLLEDLDAFLEFVEGRTFDLAPRTLGFRREALADINGRMGRPARLHSRPVQSDAPRVQCCFETARALGLLRVIRTLHRVEATPEVARFRAMDEVERLWAVLEAMWQRVPWAVLRPRAYGDTEAQQAGRYWLGAELSRRAAPVRFDGNLAGEAEVMEVFLLPFWRDAGLVDLTHNRRMPMDASYAKRSTRLSRAEPTGAGRRIFALLSEASPGHEYLEATAHQNDGRWQGQRFLWRIVEAANRVRFGSEEWSDEEWTDDE